ncbi:ATP-binding protein [Lysinibacillus capsici]|uniref:AlbA family DNA-binding domain-containing protein n=1 Tax=Lysinibacillus capsici TaxID=2115968 RepID=UPI002E20EAFB|nr:ATP-binding protein [Lysinibacillus capsici]
MLKSNLYMILNNFLEEPNHVLLRELIKENAGEFNNLDFKESSLDSVKLAKHILALSNHGGGCIIFGIKEDRESNKIEIVGLKKDELEDKADVYKALKKYLPENVLNEEHLLILDFDYDESEYAKLKDKYLRVVTVQDNPLKLPYMSKANGGQKQELLNNRIYIRSGTETIEANQEQINKMIKRRIKAAYNSRNEMDINYHLKQLKDMYAYKTSSRNDSPLLASFNSQIKYFEKQFGISSKVEFEDYITELIIKKKKRIELELDVLDI